MMMGLRVCSLLLVGCVFQSLLECQHVDGFVLLNSESFFSCHHHPSLLLLRSTTDDKDEETPTTETSAHYELTDAGYPAYPQQTPHSGRHFLPSHPYFQKKRPRKNKRFMEGWYYRLTIPNVTSFAFIFSIEDPGRKVPVDGKPLNLAAVQVLGPDDEYLLQADRDDTKFWAYESTQSYGCTFEWKDDNGNNATINNSTDSATSTVLAKDIPPALHPDEWKNQVETGFQMLPTRLQGRVQGHDGTNNKIPLQTGKGTDGYCEFDLNIEPISGWGDKGQKQRSTAGWLASYSVFEPHWQVTLADARVTGFVTWKGQKYEFWKDPVPFYGEKNWGGAFPSKWYWVQCNSFQHDIPLAVTAGGGRRKIPLGQTEDLGMVSVHYDGVFYEAVPWTGDMEWDVDPWGYWKLRGRCTSGNNKFFEVELMATCHASDGVVLRAPTKEDGMVYFCKDSFVANMTLSLWELEPKKNDFVRGTTIIDNAYSNQGAVEIGGGPWWDTWKGRSNMKQPMKSLVGLPYKLRKKS